MTVLNSTSHRPIAGLTVNFLLQAEDFTGPCGGTLSSASGTTNANGSAVVSLGVPGCYIGSKASLSATLFSDGYFGENSTSIGINLLGFAGFLAFIQQFPYNVIAFLLIMVVAISVGVLIGRRRQRRRAARQPVLPPAMGAGPVLLVLRRNGPFSRPDVLELPSGFSASVPSTAILTTSVPAL